MMRPQRLDELRREVRSVRSCEGGVRGKYAARYKAGTNLVGVLSPDVAKYSSLRKIRQ